MPAAAKFVLNKGTVAMIAKRDPALAKAVDAVADEVRARSGPTATVDTYTTDRHVAGVVVTSVAQARTGAATRAAQSVAAEHAGNVRISGGIKSRAQWRFLAANDRDALRAAAHGSARYSSLPERSPSRAR
jgi:hypothetical protein